MCFIFLQNLYLQRFHEIDNFNIISLGNQKNEEITDFVDRLLPRHVQSSINSTLNNSVNFKIGELYENVTLLFADIVGFTAYSSGKTPSEVVTMLSELFTDFDKECNAKDLYKVYTIGDCYVVMGF